MKKPAALLLALCLAFTLPAAAFAATYSAGGYYTVDYPDALTLDDTSYADENTEEDVWLFMLSGDDYLIDASINTVDDYAGFSLYDATEEEKQAYLAEVADTFADKGATLVDTVMPESGIPFYIFSMEDSDGPYYFAETIANGASVSFCCYYDDAGAALDEPLLNHLKEVLVTFRPTTAAQAT